MIKLQAFIDYLTGKGWKPVTYYDPHTLVFVRTVNDEQQVVALPADEKYSNYTFQIDSALDRLALCEGISKYQARVKVAGGYLISVEEVITLITSKMRENDSVDDLTQLAKHDVLEEILNDINEINKHLLKD